MFFVLLWFCESPDYYSLIWDRNKTKLHRQNNGQVMDMFFAYQNIQGLSALPLEYLLDYNSVYIINLSIKCGFVFVSDFVFKICYLISKKSLSELWECGGYWVTSQLYRDTLKTHAAALVSVKRKKILKVFWNDALTSLLLTSTNVQHLQKISIHLSKGNENHSSWDNHCHSLLSITSRKITVRQILNCWTDECAENASHRSRSDFILSIVQ